jgi:hypothetical protein
MRILFAVLLFTLASSVACTSTQNQNANTPASMADHNHDMTNISHTEGVMQRGDEVMGFDHAKTTHHFRLLPDGGAIEVEVNDANDTASRDQIWQHLSHIAEMFAEGNFNAPMLIHGREPDGVPVMKDLKSDIKYQYEQTDKGARVRISTTNPEALKAIHDFLRFQINDHQTGDPTEVQN